METCGVHIETAFCVNKGYTAWHVACVSRHLDVVRCMVECFGVNVEAKTARCGGTALLLAVHDGDVDVVQYLVETAAANVCATFDSSGDGALHVATTPNLIDLDMIRYLVQTAGVPVLATNKNGTTALQILAHRWNDPNAAPESHRLAFRALLLLVGHLPADLER